MTPETNTKYLDEERKTNEISETN
ncbi:hypothetical protein AYI69_g10306, partial [Smittium culicis]